MDKVRKNFTYIILILLIIISTPYFGELYKIILGRPIGGWFWGPAHPEYFEGFFMSFMFFVPLFVVFFGGTKKYRNLAILAGMVLLFDLFLGAIEEFVIDIVFALLGWVLAEIGLRASQKITHK